MASLVKDKNGTRRIQFIDGDRKRRTIRLGRMPLKDCRTVKSYVEKIVISQISGDALESEIVRWIADRPQWLYDKLANAGLAKKRELAILTDYVQAYIDSRTDVKERTIWKYEAVKRYLDEHFDGKTLVRDVTEGDADSFKLFLKSKISSTTASKYLAITKQFFESARRKKLITENPFAGIKTTVSGSMEKFYFVTRKEAESVLKACPDAEWRLIVSLSRYGGLRCPSEHLALTWDDIDWDKKRIRIPSPKTEHHEGKAYRVIPMFPELTKALNDVWDDPRSDGTKFVINRYRDTNSNLRTQFHRICDKAKVSKWNKPFQNMRSTRETELAEEYPIQVVCSWIGNSPKVAMKHYLQTTESHFEKAIGKAAQNAAQSVSESAENRPTAATEKCKKPREKRKNAGVSECKK